MSKMSELAYDIEQLYIEGYGPRLISQMLECPVEIVYEWIEGNSLDTVDEDMDPYNTINS